MLVELGRRTALVGDNYFRAKAYQRAADALSALVEPLDRVIAQNRLCQLPGIGETIADIVTKLHNTGTHLLLEKLRREVPEGVLDMLSIPGLKPEKVNILHRELTDLDRLEAAVREDRLKNVKGLGAAIQRKILDGLKIREHARGARHLHRADELARSAAETLERSVLGLIRTVTAGDLRRGGELVSNLALVAEVERLSGPSRVITSGDMSVYLNDARRFGVSLLFATGSSKHLEALQRWAADRGMALTLEGLRRRRKIIAAETEAEIYEALGLQYIEPELREGLDEVERAAAHKIPPLVTAAELLGVLHAHTTATGVDGEIAGVVALAPGDAPDTLNLNKRFVEPRHIRSGVGRALLAHAVAEARQRGAERLTILADPNAAGFYERNGAVRIGEAPSDAVPGRLLPLYELSLTPRGPS